MVREYRKDRHISTKMLGEVVGGLRGPRLWQHSGEELAGLSRRSLLGAVSAVNTREEEDALVVFTQTGQSITNAVLGLEEGFAILTLTRRSYANFL